MKLGLTRLAAKLSGTVAATLTATIGTPVLTLTSGNLVYPPTFSVALDVTVLVGDTLDFQYALDAGFTSSLVSNLHVITSGEAIAQAVNLSLSGIVSGTHRNRCRIERGNLYTAWSTPVITQGPNDVAPVLSAFTATAVTSSAATVGVTTDQATGTLYHLRNTSAAAATVATIVGTGTALAITTSGAKTFALSGLAAVTTYYDHFAHAPSVGPTSLELIGNFTTSAAVATTWDPANKAAAITLTNANLTYANTSGGSRNTVRGTNSRAPTFVGGFAITVGAYATNAAVVIGIGDSATVFNEMPGRGTNTGVGFDIGTYGYEIWKGNVSITNYTAIVFATGDIVSVALDGAGNAQFKRNGTNVGAAIALPAMTALYPFGGTDTAAVTGTLDITNWG